MEVREIMSAVVLTIPASQSCHEAALRMSRLNVHHLPVVAERDRLVGIVTDRDLRHYLFAVAHTGPAGAPPAAETLLSETPVTSVMSAPVVTVGPATSVQDAIGVMTARKVGALPVVEDERLVGILTESDVLRLLARRYPLCCAEVERVLRSAA